MISVTRSPPKPGPWTGGLSLSISEGTSIFGDGGPEQMCAWLEDKYGAVWSEPALGADALRLGRIRKVCRVLPQPDRI
jgi:hypothetical protein